MDIHIVGGFLGAGKTTAIINASKVLSTRGKKVAVITNDQGRYLVDTAFSKLSDIPSTEVTGGCFCCRYDDFEAVLSRLQSTQHPDVVFAESVGSCADVVVTVLEPLREAIHTFVKDGLGKADFSVFTDIRLLLAYLKGRRLPFSDDVVYLYERQIEEAGLLVLNKIDLLSEEARNDLERLVQKQYGNIPYITLSGRKSDDAEHWLSVLDSSTALQGRPLRGIDYRRYGAGETRLAWFDGVLNLALPKGSGNLVLKALETLAQEFREKGWGVGHVKAILQDEHGNGWKWSTVSPESNNEVSDPSLEGPVRVLLNARVETRSPELEATIRKVFADFCNQHGVPYAWEYAEAFHPAEPRPQRGRRLENHSRS